ncbi:MAG: SIR2 family protein [Anaerolineae bacterium]|nr:SIR2 family protein [Anaerolineae bacterium]
MPNALSDRDWKNLLRRVDRGHCTPIIGDGALTGDQPRQCDIATRWAKEYDYPLPDASDLARVAQYMAVIEGLLPREDIIDLINCAPPFDPNVPNDIHNVLARLPFVVYVTTNASNAMTQALAAQHKSPKREICRWKPGLEYVESVFDSTQGFEPDVANPVVYHLYGSEQNAASLVVTEDDHLDYLVNVSLNNHGVIPPRIRRALAEPSLLFIGYQLDTVAFRVLFRGIVHAINRLGQQPLNLAVQLPPDNADAQIEYFEAYFENFADLRVRVYWGTVEEFAEELDDRWREYQDG